MISLPDGLVKGGTEELTVIFGEIHTRDAFTVSTLKSSQTLSCYNFPNLQEINYVL